MLRTQYSKFTLVAPVALALVLGGCGTATKLPSTSSNPAPYPQKPTSSANREPRSAPSMPAAGSGRGGYYQDDGPGENPPEGLQAIPDAEPKIEPYSTRGNRPYVVFGKTYTPMTDNQPFKQRGVGSWYGKKFHGQKTSSGELYDMYKMTAAHPTLPIPSYARVTNTKTGTQVIVRVNDRGPFHSSRVIDLSYTAALKLGYLGKGSSELEVERLLPEEIARLQSNRPVNSSVAVQDVRAVPAAVAMPVAQTITIDDLIGSGPAPNAASFATLPVAMKIDVNPSQSESGFMPVVAIINSPVSNFVPQPASALSSGIFLQLGSFSQSDNAQSEHARLMPKWSATLPAIEVVQSGALHRLYAGPFASRQDAAAAALQIQDAAMGIPRPFIVLR